jgi:hypothetical protein
LSEINNDEEVEPAQEIDYTIPQADSSTLMTPPYKIEGRPPRVMKERVNLRDIKGSLKENELFDRFFRPKIINKKIKRIWKWIAGQQKSRKTFEGISLTKISSREYYVFEGTRRISALKHLGWRQIDVIVADFSHLKTGKLPVYRKPRGYDRQSRESNYNDSRYFSPRSRRPSNIQTDEKKKRY